MQVRAWCGCRAPRTARPSGGSPGRPPASASGPRAAASRRRAWPGRRPRSPAARPARSPRAPARRRSAARHAAVLEAERDVALDGPPGKHGVLLEDVADLGRRGAGDPLRRPPRSRRPTARRGRRSCSGWWTCRSRRGPRWPRTRRSWTSKDTGETAGTSRGPWPKVFERSRMETRTRGATAAGLLVLGLRLLDEAHVHRLLVRDRLVDRGGHPHLHAALVVLLLDDEVPVEDRPVVADRVQHHLALEGVHVGLPEQIRRPRRPWRGGSTAARDSWR